MREPLAALAYLEAQRVSGATSWSLLCERLCRSAYGLGPHYPSANAHAKAIPAKHRHGHEAPSRGDLILYRNATFGHIVVATGNGWECYTNDFGGRGRVTKTDARNLVAWCNATEWFVADAWWSESNWLGTHTPPPPPEPKPDPVPDPVPVIEEDTVFIFKSHQNDKPTGEGVGNGRHFIVTHGYAVQCDKGYRASENVPVISSPSEAMDKAFFQSVKMVTL